MAEKDLESVKDAAEYLGINYMTLYKITSGTYNPTVQQGITLCKKCGYSANWLFLNVGDPKMKHQAMLNEIQEEIKEVAKIVRKTVR